ncbi:MAG: HutD family protein [Piscinibacter sp.]
MSAAPRRIDVATLPAQRWKNGAGLTREIATGPDGAGIDDFDWRLSVAELEHDAPFSAFPGIDRCIVVLDGAGMTLHDAAGGEVRELRPLEPWAFGGETTLSARLPAGPCRDFNVMTRRGRWRATLDMAHDAARFEVADAALLLAVRGHWRLGDETVAPMQGLLWSAPGEAIELRPLDADAALLRLRLCQDVRP